MSQIILKAENISKQYRLGQLGTGTISHDLNRWWHKVRGKEDPYLKVGDVNDRSQAGGSEYVWSLRDVSFDVRQGEVLGIIGKNGAGKSTLLKILSQVTTPTTGQVKVKGRIASLLEVGTGFHPELSGRENIFLNGAILGMSKNEIRSKLDEIVDFSGVAKYLDTPVKRYSSGMMVRLGFAVAAHLEPEILIVDEVLAVGDAEFQKKCLGKMKEVSGAGRTVLFVSHQLGMVKALCTRGMMLKKGQIAFIGSVEDTLDEYSKETAGESESLTHKVFKNGATQKGAVLKEARLLNAAGEEKSAFDVFEQVVVEIKYELKKPMTGLAVGLNLSRNGELIMCSFDTDENDRLLGERVGGSYITRAFLPCPIKAGTYSITSVGIGLTNVEGIDAHDDVFQFIVEERSFDPTFKSFSRNRPGVMYSSLKWQTEVIHG